MTVFWFIIALIELGVIVAGIVIYLRNKKYQNIMVENAKQIVKGRLNIDDIPVAGNKTNSDIISGGLNSIKTNLLTFVEATKRNFVVVSDAVDMLNNSMKTNTIGNDHIAQNTLKVGERTAKQLEMVQDNMAVIQSNSVQLEEIGSFMNGIKDMLDDTAKMSDSGIDNLEGYAKDMDTVSSDLNSINESLNHFNEQIKNVYEVGDFIVGISTQLKLLSFNASIEAARAGQAGRGFAVVADEMTGMSEQTKEGMDRISSILSDIMESSSSVTESIVKCTNTYNNSKEAFGEVNKSFRAINAQANDIQKKIAEINDMFKVMENNSDHSKDIAEQLYDTSRDINDMTSEIAGISQEVAAEATQIGSNSEALNDMIDGIQKLLLRFDTGVLPVKDRPNKIIRIAIMSMHDNDFWFGVKHGADYAARELTKLKAEVRYIPLVATRLQSVDDLVISAFNTLIDEKFDAIIYPGFLGGIEGLLTKAKNAGIKLMTYNCDYSNPNLRLACVKSDSIAQGEMAAKAAANLMDKSGNVAVMIGNLDVIGNVERKQGFADEIGKYKAMKVVSEVVVADDGDDVYRKTLDLLNKNSNVDIIFLTNGFPHDAARAIVDAKRAGRTKLIGFDLNPELFPYIKNGAIGTIISQDAFGQGHDPIVLMYNHIVAGKPFPSQIISCRQSVADATNIDDLIEG